MNNIAACLHDPLAVPQMALHAASVVDEREHRGGRRYDMTAQLEQGNLMAAPDAIEKERTCTQDG